MTSSTNTNKRDDANAKIVVDTNVWVSAIVFGGRPNELLKYIVAHGVSIVLAPEIELEIRRTIARKFPNFIEDLEALLAVLDRCISYVDIDGNEITASRDLDDDKFIETAVAGGAKYIISGDKDLLELGSYDSIKIIRPADYLQL